MPYFGNKEIKLETITHLTQYFDLKGSEEDDTIYLTPKKETYSAAEVMDIADLIGSLCPNECDLNEGALRLWWD